MSNNEKLNYGKLFSLGITPSLLFRQNPSTISPPTIKPRNPVQSPSVPQLPISGDVVEGEPLMVIARLSDKIYKWHRCGFKFKIGITDNPERRWKECYAKDYSKMFVLYRTSISDDVRSLEQKLVYSFWDVCDNQAFGGAGNLSVNAPYFLYVVLVHKRTCSKTRGF